MGKEPIFSIGQQYTVTELTTASRLIFSGRCVLFTVLLAGDGEAADCQIFDGRTEQGKEILHLEVPQSNSFQWSCPIGTVFEKGIYIKVSGSGAHVAVSYSPLEKKSFRGE